MLSLSWNSPETLARPQLKWLQVGDHDDDDDPLLTEVFQVLGSLLMNPLDLFESLLSKEEPWFEESESSCQRTFEKYKHEGDKEKARILCCLGVLNIEEGTSIYRQ